MANQEPTLDRDSGEIVIEIATPQNGYVFFGPLGNEKLRGRWDSRNVAGKSGDFIAALSECHFYPGIRLGVNLRTGVTRRFDPLGTPEFKHELAVANKVAATFPQVFNGSSKVRAGDEYRQTPENEDAEDTANRLKDWLYQMRQLVDNKMAVIVGGDLPDLKTIRERVPGSRRRHHSNETWEELDREGKVKSVWVDGVPVKGKREPQGAAT